MGICGSTREKKEDEVWQRGSFSVRSMSSGDEMDDEEMNAARNRDPEVAQRKRLTLMGNLVGAVDLSQTQASQAEALRQFQMEQAVANENPRKVDDNDFQDCHYVALSKKGYVPYDNKVNQDSLICLEKVKHNIPNLDMHFFGVLDGHGHHGRPVSQEITAKFPIALEAQLSKFKTVEELTDDAVSQVLKEAIDIVAKDLERTPIPLQHSGTTFCGSLIFNNTIYTANVGDSQGFVLSQVEGEKYKIFDLNYLHNPDVPEEKARIEACGGIVSQIPGLPPSEAGPFRIWLPDMSGPGLAMARSIGDAVAHSVGAIHEPSINIRHVDASCKYCLWASDGVFEFLTTDDVAQIILSNNNLKDIAKSVVKQSVKMWRKYDQVVDDITVVLLQLPEMAVAE